MVGGGNLIQFLEMHLRSYACVTVSMDPLAGSVQCGTTGLWWPWGGLPVSGGHPMCHQNSLHLQHAGLQIFPPKLIPSSFLACAWNWPHQKCNILWLVCSCESSLKAALLFVARARCLCPSTGEIHLTHCLLQHHRDEAEEHWHYQDAHHRGPHWWELPGQFLAWGIIESWGKWAGYSPERVASSSWGDIWALGCSVHCSREPQQCSEGVLQSPTTTRT